MTELSFDALPDLALSRRLIPIAQALWCQDEVRVLWIGGSLASGNADPYSDVDLRVAVCPEALEAWQRPDCILPFQDQVLGRQYVTFATDTCLHHLVLASGDVYDLWVQSVERVPSPETVLILGSRDAAFAQRLRQPQAVSFPPDPPAEGNLVRQLLVDFWISTHKHRKVLYRDLPLIAIKGVQLDQAALLRLWYILATDQDMGDQRPTIHSLTKMARVIQQAQGTGALETIGAPLTSRELIHQAIERIRDEVSAAGQQLAQRLGFEYPYALERKVRDDWTEFKRASAASFKMRMS